MKANRAAAAPHIEGKTLDGKPFRLASLKGKVLLLDEAAQADRLAREAAT